ncbi:MAG: AAA family ATPase [Planctomycetota bacterium]
MSGKAKELPAEALRWRCDAKQLRFRSTEELPGLGGLIGQDRAQEALDFGVAMDSYGYNIFVLGPRGTGKNTAVRKVLERRAAQMPVPPDWCYVNNFDDPKSPRALRLPVGKGRELAHDMDELVSELSARIPRAFEGESYQAHRRKIMEEFQEKRREMLQALQGKAAGNDFSLTFTPQGIAVIPMVEGEPIDPKKYETLSDEKKQEIERKGKALHEELQERTKEIRNVEKALKERVAELDRQVASFAVGDTVAELRRKYASLEGVTRYLEQVEKDILERVQDFVRATKGEEGEEVEAILPGLAAPRPTFERYKVNVIVDHSSTKGAPVVTERNPTFYNLVGRLEYRATMGTMTTDFTMIGAGALHRANGGFLVLEVKDVLMNPFAWEALKRALATKEVRTEDMNEQFRLVTVTRLEAEPIAFSAKVVLIGSPWLYYLLNAYDEDFRKLFKVMSHMDVQTDRTEETIQSYSRYVGELCRTEGLMHLAPGAVAEVIEHAARLAEDQEKLATTFSEVADLVRETSFWAGRNGRKHAEREDVRKALEQLKRRNSLIEERIQELIEKDVLMVDAEGAKVGQVNGLSVSQMGDYEFGRPNRITARVYVGSAGVLNIEREAKMSGSIHDKGVMILTGYLGGRYALSQPLSMSASICFEQSYSGVEGDSASATELFALVSSLSEMPLSQGIAVTGSVNQRGEIQPVGGVTTKIEGFFDVCSRKGLTGKQGVMIPSRNVRSLMLKEEVVNAVREGKFHIWAIDTVDRGIELLTGKAAGERRKDGTYPKGTVNAAVQERLKKFAEGMKRQGKATARRRTRGERASGRKKRRGSRS